MYASAPSYPPNLWLPLNSPPQLSPPLGPWCKVRRVEESTMEELHPYGVYSRGECSTVGLFDISLIIHKGILHFPPSLHRWGDFLYVVAFSPVPNMYPFQPHSLHHMTHPQINISDHEVEREKEGRKRQKGHCLCLEMLSSRPSSAWGYHRTLFGTHCCNIIQHL